MAYPNTPGFKVRGTSSEAARRVAPRAKRLLDRIQDFIETNYPASFTADQIAALLGEPIFSVRPRVSELHRGGKIVNSGARAPNASGMTATAWRAIHPSEECPI